MTPEDENGRPGRGDHQILATDQSTDGLAFLNWLYGTDRDDLISISSYNPSYAHRACSSNAEAVQYAEALDNSGAHGTYFRFTTLPIGFRGKRGTSEDSAYAYCLHADMDLKGPGHVATNYPETQADLDALLEKAGLPQPSAWLHSGGGRNPVWKFADRAPYAEVADLITAWARHLQEWHVALGWKMDGTFDGARVAGMPGTHNRKPERNGDHPMRHVMRMDGPVFQVEALKAILADAPKAPSAKPAPAPALPQRDTQVPQSSLFASPSDLTGQERTRRAYTDAEAAEYLTEQEGRLRENLWEGNVYKAMSGFLLQMLHFEQAFSWLTRDLMVGRIAAVAKEHLTWEELDGQDMEKIQRTFRRWDNGEVDDMWQAERITVPEQAAPGKSLRDRLLTVDTLLSLPLPKPLIKGVLDLESATWLIAQPGGFKSFVALDWSCHVAAGKEWQGRKTLQRPVVYVLAEGKGNFRKRVQAWIERHGATPENLYILPVAVQARGKDKGTVSEQWAELVEMVKDIRPGLIVLDTQARLTVGMEENNANEMGVWIHAVEALKEATEACVLVVHHTGRNGGDARGSSALDGAQDAEWRVDRKAHKLAMTLSCDKNKDGDDRTAIDFVMDVVELGTDEDGGTITSLVLGQGTEHNVWTEAQETDKEGLDAILARGGGIRCQDLVLGVVRSLDDGQGLTRAEVQRLGNEALKEHPSKGRPDKYAEGSYRKAISDLVSVGKLEQSDDGTPRYSTLE